MPSYRVLMPLLAALLLGAAILACGQLGAAPSNAPAWTPAPVQSAQAPAPGAEPAATAGEAVLPTVAPAPPAARQASGAAARPAVATPVPTQDPHHVVITDSDITSSLGGAGLAQSGVQADNLAVHFRGGKTSITANRVVYGPLNMQNLTVVGHLVARDGALQMDTESVEPGGLVSGMVPGIINQALKQYASQWYVEDVQTGEGQIELRIR